MLVFFLEEHDTLFGALIGCTVKYLTRMLLNTSNLRPMLARCTLGDRTFALALRIRKRMQRSYVNRVSCEPFDFDMFSHIFSWLNGLTQDDKRTFWPRRRLGANLHKEAEQEALLVLRV